MTTRIPLSQFLRTNQSTSMEFQDEIDKLQIKLAEQLRLNTFIRNLSGRIVYLSEVNWGGGFAFFCDSPSCGPPSVKEPCYDCTKLFDAFMKIPHSKCKIGRRLARQNSSSYSKNSRKALKCSKCGSQNILFSCTRCDLILCSKCTLENEFHKNILQKLHIGFPTLILSKLIFVGLPFDENFNEFHSFLAKLTEDEKFLLLTTRLRKALLDSLIERKSISHAKLVSQLVLHHVLQEQDFIDNFLEPLFSKIENDPIFIPLICEMFRPIWKLFGDYSNKVFQKLAHFSISHPFTFRKLIIETLNSKQSLTFQRKILPFQPPSFVIESLLDPELSLFLFTNDSLPFVCDDTEISKLKNRLEKQKLTSNSPTIFVIVGSPGSGKTTLSQIFQNVLGIGKSLEGRGFLHSQMNKNEFENIDSEARKFLCYSLFGHKNGMLCIDGIKSSKDARLLISICDSLGIQISNTLVLYKDFEHSSYSPSFGDDSLHLRDWETMELRENRMNKWSYNAEEILELFSSNCCSISVGKRLTGLHFDGYSSKAKKRSFPENILGRFSEFEPILCDDFHAKCLEPVINFDTSNIVKSFALLSSGLTNTKSIENLFSNPTTLITSRRKSKFVAIPGNYSVTRKAKNSIRYFLVGFSGTTYAINQSGMVYFCGIDTNLPNGTVLDSEFVAEINQKHHMFLVVDGLSIKNKPIWHLQLQDRVFSIREQLGLDVSPSLSNIQTNKTFLLSKEISWSVTNDELERLFLKPTFYSCDGLIFIPTRFFYCFGNEPLLFKWQNQNDIHFEIGSANTNIGHNDGITQEKKWWQLIPGLIAECCGEEICDETSELLDIPKYHSFQSVNFRADKRESISDELIDIIFKAKSKDFNFEKLLSSIKTVTHVPIFIERKDISHPSKLIPFDNLIEELEQRVSQGLIEETIDETTGLAIFNYFRKSNDRFVSMSRGLILDLKEKKVVSCPFISITEEAESEGKNILSLPVLLSTVEATAKIDGSLGIMFLYQNQVYVFTRRRGASEQAKWATEFVRNSHFERFLKSGFTYLVEVVGGNNTVIINYPFNGIVLLSVTNEFGIELSYSRKLLIANELGIPIVPRMIGHLEDFMLNNRRREKETKSIPTLFEGWVIKSFDGQRTKIVKHGWKNAWNTIHNLGLDGIIQQLIYKHNVAISNISQFHYLEIIQMFKSIYYRVYSIKQKSPFPCDLTFYHQISFFANKYYQLLQQQQQDLNLRNPNSISETVSLLVPKNMLDIIILEYISKNISTLDYVPSQNFLQTWVKGWNRKKQAKEQLQPDYVVFNVMNSVIPFLQFKDLLNCRCVCSWIHDLIDTTYWKELLECELKQKHKWKQQQQLQQEKTRLALQVQHYDRRERHLMRSYGSDYDSGPDLSD